MTCKQLCIGLGLILLIVGGCQTAQTPREKDKQANAYLDQAQAYESQGNLIEALEQYKLAETIDPDEAVVVDGIQRLEQKLQSLADTHYRTGLRFRDKGKWQLAKKEFLKALKYWPDHEKAAAMLQQRQPKEVRKFVTHQIAPGESISKLAIKYYGDYRKYHHIANFNNMTDATRVRVGQRVMIPVIEGVTIDDLIRTNTTGVASPPSPVEGDHTLHRIEPGQSLSKVAQIYYGDFSLFHVIAKYNGIDDPTSVKVGQTIKVPRLQKEAVATADDSTTESVATYLPETEDDAPEVVDTDVGAVTPEAVADEDEPEVAEVVDQVTEYRDAGIAFFNQEKYEEAIVELKKALSADSDDDITLRYISRSYAEMGKIHLKADRIDQARSALNTALEYDDTCRDCRQLLEQSQSSQTNDLRAEGEAYFRNNQFDKAIASLQRAVALNPDDDVAQDLLFQTHYQKALIRYDKQDYLAARDEFSAALQLKPNCSDCQNYIDNSLSAYLESNYNEGIVYFGQEELKKAIVAWEKVSAVDPDYKDVRQNLKKATLLNDRLERIKKSSAE